MEVRAVHFLVLWVSLLLTRAESAMEPTPTVTESSLKPEEEQNSVRITFYQVDPDEWRKEEGTLRFKTKDQIAAAVNEICTTDEKHCGQGEESQWVEIEKEHVGCFGSMTVDNFYMNVSIYVKVPSGGGTVVLQRATTHDAIVKARLPVHAETGRAIIAVGSDKFSPPPDHGMNQILIPVFIVILIIIPIIILFATKKFRPKQKKYKKDQHENPDTRPTSVHGPAQASQLNHETPSTEPAEKVGLNGAEHPGHEELGKVDSTELNYNLFDPERVT